MARLVIFDESVRGVDLEGHPVILGRSRRADIPIRDSLLSRKHCSIVPTRTGFQVIDLKSSNGTFVNGKRVEKQDLGFEDIVEIGNTVMTVLDTDTWKRGGLPRLRHPSKARSLVRAIQKREVAGKGAGKVAGGAERRKYAALRQKRALTPSETEFLEWAREAIPGAPAARELLENYVAVQVASLLVRHSPDLARRLSDAVEKVLTTEAFRGGPSELREAARRAVDEALAPGDADTMGDPGPEARRARSDGDPEPGRREGRGDDGPGSGRARVDGGAS
jgi:pSer/pThr/pTyr-binding forkhead associated (FHA) protein